VEARQLFATVAERAGLSREEAADLTRSAAAALAARLSGGAARDLAERLPEPLAEGLRAGSPAVEKFGREEFVGRVSQHTGLTTDETTAGLRALLATLREELGADAFDQAVSQLPGDIRELITPPDET
jgi:uncharacterized protein (DUF2267 family)